MTPESARLQQQIVTLQHNLATAMHAHSCVSGAHRDFTGSLIRPDDHSENQRQLAMQADRAAANLADAQAALDAAHAALAAVEAIS